MSPMNGAGPPQSEEDLKVLEKAVSDLEQKLASERTSFLKMKLRSQIRELKETYNRQKKQPVLEAKKKTPVRVHVDRDGAAVSSRKLCISGLVDSTIKPDDCVEALISNCRNTTFEYFECQNSVVLENLQECTVCCLGQQIRVVNCCRVKLSCFSYSGVFLQDSSEIKIAEYTHSEISNVFNKFDVVYDFSDPCSSKNYTLVK